MRINYPFLAWLTVLPLAWCIWQSRTAQNKLPLLLKTLSFSAILFALSQPVINVPSHKVALAVLADTSQSIDEDELATASSAIDRMAKGRGRNRMKLLPFSRDIRPSYAGETGVPVHLQTTRDEGGNATNFERALRSAMASLPSGYLPRVLLLSDGNVTDGATAGALAELRHFRVPVDTIPLHTKSKTDLQLTSVTLPRDGFVGAQVPIDLVIASSRDATAKVTLSAENRPIGQQTSALRPGTNTLRVDARMTSEGVNTIAGKVTVSGSGSLQFEGAVALRRAKILYLSHDPPGSDKNLLAVFQQAQCDLIRNPSDMKGQDLSDIQLVVINNLDLNQFSLEEKSQLEDYVKNGGGLLLIGGEQQVFKEDKRLDALDRALPAKLAPPKRPEGTSVVLIIDKSSSMEGRKIELARLSAIGVVDHLRPVDSIGVLIFDNSFQWAVPMRRAEDKSLIQRLISGITPDGGTQIAPALTEAYRKIASARSTYKHIVLLTDGISEEGDSFDLAKEALQHEVTISTVGLGQDVNRSYLEKVATISGGRSYFLSEPQGLEQILLKDVLQYSGSTSIERPLSTAVVHQADILRGIDFATAPPLKGYVRFIAQPGAETLLSISGSDNEPLFTRWQYGLGRAAVFTSDAKSRWAQNWVTWPGYDRFWTNVTRDLLSHTGSSEGSATFDSASGDLVVEYHDTKITGDTTFPDIFAIGPGGFRRQVHLHRTSTGAYQSHIHIGELTGTFRVRPLETSPLFPEIGFYRAPPEHATKNSNDLLLQQISHWTGGKFNPAPEEAFDSNGRTILSDWQLWPGLLALAIALTLAELLTRKWTVVQERLRKFALRVHAVPHFKL